MVRKPVYLGAIRVWWCHNCNLPLISKQCDLCSGDNVRPITITPPGDVRPAFDYDVFLFLSILEEKFGLQGDIINSLSSQPILLNRIPHEDKAYEIIMCGTVVAIMVYDIEYGWNLMPRIPLANYIAKDIKKGYIVVDNGAVGPISHGASVLTPGVSEMSSDLSAGDPAIVLSPEGEAIATASMKVSFKEYIDLKRKGRGTVAKTRWHKARDTSSFNIRMHPLGTTWSEIWHAVVKANTTALEEMEERGIAIIKHAVARYSGKEPVVAFSGGKDSLASLLISLASGLRPRILFNDTGIEFNETVEYVHKIAKKYGLEVVCAKADDAFWKHLPYFGPPSKDYRWCCKLCKLGPTVRAIKQHFPNGIIGIIGQRRYESQERAKKGSIWQNPWVPGQIGVSPIQNWNALTVWLYIFYKKEEYNPWYLRGFDRIGCYLCPSTDMGEFIVIEREYPDYNRFKSYLEGYMRSKGYPPQYLFLGLWRWRHPPSWIRKRFPSLVKNILSNEVSTGRMVFTISEPYTSCGERYTIEGTFSRPLHLERCIPFLAMHGILRLRNGGIAEIETSNGDRITVFEEGAIIVESSTERDAIKILQNVSMIIVRSHECVGCGICIGYCPTGALYIKDGRIFIETKKCIKCFKCLKGPCPVTAYG